MVMWKRVSTDELLRLEKEYDPRHMTALDFRFAHGTQLRLYSTITQEEWIIGIPQAFTDSEIKQILDRSKEQVDDNAQLSLQEMLDLLNKVTQELYRDRVSRTW
jgi:hypothetical protein